MSDAPPLLIDAIDLMHLRFDANADFAARLRAGTAQPPGIALSYEFADDFSQDGDATVLLQEVELSVVFNGPDGTRIVDPAQTPFILSVRMAGQFRIAGDAPAKRRDALLVGASALMFPFLREVVASVTQRSVYPALLIPPANIVELRSQARVSGQAFTNK